MPARGTGKYGSEVIVGTPEYWKLWRRDNKDKQKLAQLRYRAKQQELALARRVAEANGIPDDEALILVRVKLEEIKVAKEQIRDDGLLNDPVQVGEDEKPNPFIMEEAEKYGVPYSIAFKIMFEEVDASKWASLLEAAASLQRTNLP